MYIGMVYHHGYRILPSVLWIASPFFLLFVSSLEPTCKILLWLALGLSKIFQVPFFWRAASSRLNGFLPMWMIQRFHSLSNGWHIVVVHTFSFYISGIPIRWESYMLRVPWFSIASWIVRGFLARYILIVLLQLTTLLCIWVWIDFCFGPFFVNRFFLNENTFEDNQAS